MGLRLEEGVPLERVAEALDPRAADRLRNLGLLADDPDRLRATPAGMLVLNSLLAELIL